MGEYSFRNFQVGEQFKQQFKECSKLKPGQKGQCERVVRGEYRKVESGRLADMGDKIHNFISHLDQDEVDSFKTKFPDATKVANEFAVIEELKQF